MKHRRLYGWNFEAALGITIHDYSVQTSIGLTIGQIIHRCAEAANEKLASGVNKRFKQGDRVTAYVHDSRFIGTVTGSPGQAPGQIKIFVDGNDGVLSVYPFELKRLKRK